MEKIIEDFGIRRINFEKSMITYMHILYFLALNFALKKLKIQK